MYIMLLAQSSQPRYEARGGSPLLKIYMHLCSVYCFFCKMLLDIVIVQCCSITSTVEQLCLVLDVVEAMMTTDP